MKALLVGVLISLPVTATAHEWYSKTKNPVTGYTCCGTNDCRSVRALDVEMTQSGYIYVPKGLSINRNEAVPSPDKNFHVCEYAKPSIEKKLRCIFVPAVPGS